MMMRRALQRSSSVGGHYQQHAQRAHLHASRPALAKILCADSIDPVCIQIFKERGHEVDYKVGLSKEELLNIIPQYHGLVVRSATKVTGDVIAAADKLVVIGRAGVGVDNIDLPAATKKGVMVMNTPGGNTVSTAQLAFSLLAVSARSLARADMSMKEGKWERSKFMGTELAGKTLAVVGCGRIGQQVAKWGQAFDMTVVGFDPVLPAASFKELGIKKCDLDKIWPQADFITLHTPLTPDTKNLINSESLAQMKKGVHIVNCARGGIVNEMDLLASLEAGHVGGAALDVYEKEPPGESTKKLLAHPNVSCTPHLGASTEEAQVNVAKDIAVQMCDTLESKDFVGVCNVGYMSIAQNKAIRPFSELAQQLGRVASQFALGKITKLTVSTWGQTDISITSPDARALLKAQALVGFLSTVDTQGVLPGIVNAPFLAEEVGVAGEALKESPALASIASPYRNLITVEAHVEGGGVTSVTGSVFGNEPCLVSLDNYKNFPALNLNDGSVLKFRNTDEPGAISGVLDVLEEHKVNIANLTLGRQDADLALCLMSVDGEVPAAAVEQLKALAQLNDVRTAKLGGKA